MYIRVFPFAQLMPPRGHAHMGAGCPLTNNALESFNYRLKAACEVHQKSADVLDLLSRMVIAVESQVSTQGAAPVVRTHPFYRVHTGSSIVLPYVCPYFVPV